MTEKLEELERQLQAIVESNPDSTERVDVLLVMADEMFSGDNPEKLLELISEIRAQSDRLAYPRGQAYAFLYEGLSCCFFAEHAKGLQRVDESQARFEQLGDEFGVAKSVMMRANLLRSIGSYDQALQGLYAALEYFQREDLVFWSAITLYDIGLLYHEIGNYEKAFESHEGALRTIKDPRLRWLEARALNGVGRALDRMGKQREALDYHHRSLTIFKELAHPMGEARALDDIGTIYYELGDHELALPFHTKSLAIRKSIRQRRAQCTSLLNIARVQLAQSDADAATKTLEEALSISEETNSRAHTHAAHQLLSEAYEQRGEYEKALSHFKEFQRTKEEVFSEQASDRIQKLQIGFEVEKAEKEAEITRLKNVELREKNERLQGLLDELRATQSQLVQSEKMAILGKLVAGLVHEMNTPLGASNSAVDVSDRCLTKIARLCEENAVKVDMGWAHELQSLILHLRNNHGITRQANDRLSKILTSLKSFSRLDEGERQTVDIHEGINATIALLEHEWDGRINVVRDYGELPPVECCAGEMNQVFMNLFSNAVESIDGPGTVTVRTRADDSHIRIVIEDTGSGIPEARLHTLFDPDFSRKGGRVKAGMGLLVSLNIVRKHGGVIDVTSQVGEGSVFTIVLPIHELPPRTKKASA